MIDQAKLERLCREYSKQIGENPDGMSMNPSGLLVSNWRKHIDLITPYATIPDPLTPDDYYCGQGKDYENSKLIATGWALIRVLPELTGLPWDEFALNYVHVLRPSKIRVSGGKSKSRGFTCDAHTWRVSIVLDDNDIIKYIDQEVEIKGGSGGEMKAELAERQKNVKRG